MPNNTAMRFRQRYLGSVVAVLCFLQAGSGQTEFPDIKDPKEVTITLQRGDAMGGSPSFQLVISGDGFVQYEGLANVFVKGKRTGRISIGAVNGLIEEFRKARFFAMNDYRSTATDMPICVTKFQVGAIEKRVVDYGLSPSHPDATNGFSSGAPEALVQLENQIDEAANSRKWVKGSVLRRVLQLH